MVNTIVYTISGWLNPQMRNRRYEGTMDTEEPCIGRDGYKLYADFQLQGGSAPLTLMLLKGRLYCNEKKVYTEICTDFKCRIQEKQQRKN